VIELEAKVAQVLTAAEVALNVGTEDGVAVGDRVRLYEDVQIFDPDSHALLGAVRNSRLNLEVHEVQARFCIARVETPAANVFADLWAKQETFISSPAISSRRKESIVPLKPGDALSVFINDDLANEE
jgi:hypothetical protein